MTMKKNILILALGLCMFSISFGQSTKTEAEQTEEPPKKMVVKRIDQSNVERKVNENNESILYRETAKLIKNPDFANFTVLIGWYKQTRTHYYYEIGWDVDGIIGLEYMKYAWAEGTASPSSKAEVDADNDFGDPIMN